MSNLERVIFCFHNDNCSVNVKYVYLVGSTVNPFIYALFLNKFDELQTETQK